MNAIELLEIMKERRSIRSYTDQPISDEDIKKILEAGRWCQSASNIQPWRLLVIKNLDVIKELSKLAGYGKFIRSASVVIAIIADKNNAPKWYIHDSSMLSHQMCLMISALGLGTCWIGNLNREKAGKLLNLKPGEHLTTVLPIGHPIRKPKQRERKNLEEIVSYMD